MSKPNFFRRLNHRRIDAGRRLKLRLMHALFSRFSKVVKLRESDAILVLRLDDKLGDSVTSTGFLNAMKQENPTSKLCVVCGESAALLFKELSFIDQIFISRKGIWSTIQLKLKLAKQNYKFIINTSHILNPRVVYLMSLLPACRKIGFENGQSKVFTDHVPLDFSKDHITDRYLKIIKTLHPETKIASLSYEIILSEPALQKAHAVITELRSRYRHIVTLNSFAGGHLRNLKKAATLELIKSLTSDPTICVLSLASRGDQQILEAWRKDLSSSAWLIYPNLSSLDENIALLSLSDVLITPDTAWVHIASALKIKLVAIYRVDPVHAIEKNAVIWAPYQTAFAKVMVAGANANDQDIDLASVNVQDVVTATLKVLGLV